MEPSDDTSQPRFLDFSQFKNKMQAMGTIMKQFGETADGHSVKKVLLMI